MRSNQAMQPTAFTAYSFTFLMINILTLRSELAAISGG